MTRRRMTDQERAALRTRFVAVSTELDAAIKTLHTAQSDVTRLNEEAARLTKAMGAKMIEMADVVKDEPTMGDEVRSFLGTLNYGSVDRLIKVNAALDALSGGGMLKPSIQQQESLILEMRDRFVEEDRVTALERERVQQETPEVPTPFGYDAHIPFDDPPIEPLSAADWGRSDGEEARKFTGVRRPMMGEDVTEMLVSRSNREIPTWTDTDRDAYCVAYRREVEPEPTPAPKRKARVAAHQGTGAE